MSKTEKKPSSLLGFMDEETKAQVQDLQKGQNIALPDGRVLEVIDATLIDPDKDNVRKNNQDYDHKSLALSIEDLGLLEPITLTKEGKRYKILTGEQRWTAWMILHAKNPEKYTYIPSIIKPVIKVKKEKHAKSVRIKTQLTENYARFDGPIFDLADAIVELWESEGKEYAIAALSQTKHASNNTALSRLKSIADTSTEFRQRINKAGIEGKGTIETLSKIEKKKPALFNEVLDKYDAGNMDKPLDTQANEIWSEISGRKKKVIGEKKSIKEPSQINKSSAPITEQTNTVIDNSSLESPQASLQADNIKIDGNILKISIKNGSELLIVIPKGLKLEVSG